MTDIWVGKNVGVGPANDHPNSYYQSHPMHVPIKQSS